ncbi:beta-galactosidase [Dysgonomonas sp. 520]|uniref:beta-galactosidase n=1 Tax=Dysgonomonas sp. 520 TaxID=2302931 RepID=UPI0013D11769|nr:beta-galactosidase [Dysgonomonas sp. 520]NDW09961.1 beta-galactosidase [Dysgonomonas sp. 520]
MKNKIILSLLICGLFSSVSFSRDIINSPEKSLMPIGAYYYPEHWPEHQWERDIKRIAELGFEFTHFAEFSWSRLEPEESKFNFEWLDKCVALAEKYGLKVIMCTPSPTPPAWLTAKHPEILVVTEDGFQVKHGMRLNANGSNPVYQQYVKRITEKLADRYGSNPVVCGWQLDNEPHYEGLYDYSPFVRSEFQKWLKNKYTTIENLNRAWGAAFWSYEFNNFEQIDLPNKNERNNNPHAKIDFKRYSADAIAEALRFQADVLRKKVSSKQWVTSNFAYYKFLPSVDLFRSKNDLDFASHTMYLLSTFLDYPEGKLAGRLGSGMELSFSSELARSVKGYTGIMELQPGQIDWGSWNSQPLPGAVRMWIWHSFALGDKFVCTYRFRQPLYGAEQFHKGIMEPDGVTVSPGGSEYVTAIKEISQLEKLPREKTIIPKDVASRTTAFLWKQDNMMSLETVKLTQSWDTWNHYYTYYQKLKTMGSSVTFIQESDAFDVSRYPFMVAPAYEMVDENLISKWKKYVSEGGNLILTTRSGMKDNNSHLWEAPLQHPIQELIGSKIEYFDQLSPQEEANVVFEGKNYTWNVWGDILSPASETEVWASYSDQFYKGKPCVVKNKIGKGSVYYIGVATKNKELEKQLLRKIYTEGGASILDLPDYVFTEYRDGYWVTVNYTSETISAPIPDSSTIVCGKKEVAPGGVAVWK